MMNFVENGEFVENGKFFGKLANFGNMANLGKWRIFEEKCFVKIVILGTLGNL